MHVHEQWRDSPRRQGHGPYFTAPLWLVPHRTGNDYQPHLSLPHVQWPLRSERNYTIRHCVASHCCCFFYLSSNLFCRPQGNNSKHHSGRPPWCTPFLLRAHSATVPSNRLQLPMRLHSSIHSIPGLLPPKVLFLPSQNLRGLRSTTP